MTTIIIPDHLAGVLLGKEGPLQRLGWRVQVSSSNVETFALHQSLHADLIVVNLDDPLLTGETLCLRVRADATLRQVAILLLCADTETAQRRAGICHANKILALPADPDRLLENIVQLLSIATRKSYRVLVQVSLEMKRHQETFYGITRNLSTTGLLLETEKSLMLHERLCCVFYLPNSRQIQATGDIARASFLPDGTHHYGIKFIELNPQTRQAIEEFVKLSRPTGA